MRDTSPEFEADYQRRMAALSPQQRLRMVGDMYEFARRTARAGILMQKPDATETEIQQAIFLRFYRDDFPPEERQRILGLIAEWHASRDRNA